MQMYVQKKKIETLNPKTKAPIVHPTLNQNKKFQLYLR